MNNPLRDLGLFVIFIRDACRWHLAKSILAKRLIDEIWNLSIRSIWIVAVVSLFVGAVLAMEIAHFLTHPMLPKYIIGYATRDILLLEFSPTIIALILAGKIGGNIASEIGSMRISEQIDALQVMGIDPIPFLVLPRILAAMLFFPILCMMSFIIALLGGWAIGALTGITASLDFWEGVQNSFNPFHLTFSCVKMSLFAFVITAIPAHCGFNVNGGAFEVGNASTRAVVNSSIALLLVNLLMTKLFLV